MSPASAEFGAELSSVGEARRFLRRALMDMGAEDLEFEACQVVSELATNSVIHAATPFEVEIVYRAEVLEIRVSDSSPKSPTTKSHSPQATTGRGLRLVATLADQWGTETRPDGKTVWCTLRHSPGRSTVPHLSATREDTGNGREKATSRPASRAGLPDVSDVSHVRTAA